MSEHMTQVERLNALREFLIDNKSKIFAAKASTVDETHYIESYVQQVARFDSRQPKHYLASCGFSSHMFALTESATLGLVVGSTLGYGHIVPYKQAVQFQAGYLGKIKLAYESPLVAGVNAEVVYENDIFEYELGTEPSIRHVPTNESTLPAWYYAILWLRHGPPQCRLMSRQQLEKHKTEYAKGWQRADSAWTTSPIAMGKKTVLSAVLKYAPVCDAARRVLQREEYLDAGVSDDVPDEAELEAAVSEGEAA